MATRITIASVNRELARLGHSERLARGSGYFYFYGGRAETWYSASVATNRLGALSLAQWIAEHDALASDYRNSGKGA